MVRTVRSMEEEARVRRVSGAGTDDCLSTPDFRDALEAETIRELLEFAAEGVRRVLVVGLEDRGNIALSLANSGQFVTVVEPDESLIEAVRERAEKEKCAVQMNFYASDYMKREFSSSGFDMAVFFSTLSRYNEPDVVVRKAVRELRAGGKFFARLRVRPSLGLISRTRSRFPLADRIFQQAADLSSHVPGVNRYLAIPDSRAFLNSVSEVLKIEKKQHLHLASPGLGWMGVNLPIPGGARTITAKAVRILSRAESMVLRGPVKDLASYLVVYATKELELGKAFRV